MRFLRSATVISGTLFLCAIGGFGAPGAPSGVEATLAKMDAAAAQFKTMAADIHKVSHTAVINESTVDDGSILVKRPKPNDMRMLVDIKKPDPKTVSVQGRKVEIYYPKINTVQEYDAGQNRHLLDQFMLLGFGSSTADLRSGYTLTPRGQETVAGQQTLKLELIPKSKEVLAHLSKVELWIDESTGMTVQQKFYMPGGDYTQATYTNVKVNPNIPDSALKLNLPKGVKRETPQK